jgi:hypothetical protein|tara:strand:+ start:7820 stop:8230 length:411 start_codon:yes stop_codon:yes gene_type:complete
MKFTIRKLNKTDYDNILLKWWKDWRWTAPPKDFLPDDGEGGFIVYDKDVPVCAGYIYITNSKVGWCDWIISNFNYKDKTNRKKALDELIKILTHTLELSGCKYSYALIKSDSLIERYKENGYIEGDKYTKEMIKRL